MVQKKSKQHINEKTIKFNIYSGTDEYQFHMEDDFYRNDYRNDDTDESSIEKFSNDNADDSSIEESRLSSDLTDNDDKLSIEESQLILDLTNNNNSDPLKDSDSDYDRKNEMDFSCDSTTDYDFNDSNESLSPVSNNNPNRFKKKHGPDTINGIPKIQLICLLAIIPTAGMSANIYCASEKSKGNMKFLQFMVGLATFNIAPSVDLCIRSIKQLYHHHKKSNPSLFQKKRERFFYGDIDPKPKFKP